MNDRAPLGRLALGATLLAGERLRLLDKPVPGGLAILIGVAERGRDSVRRVLRRTGDMAREVAPRPPEPVRRLLDEARTRGEKTIHAGRREAEGWLKTAMDDSIRWAERTVIPRVLDDMTPYLINHVVPRVIEGVMPQVRRRVVPVIAEDLAAERSHGHITEATQPPRDGSAHADEQLEDAFRRMFKA